MELPLCRWRELTANHGGQFRCTHAQVHAPDQLVSREICCSCSLREEGEASEAAFVCGAIVEAPHPARHVKAWAVGVTTAPRRTPTLPRCLKSLAIAGWEEPRLFAEPGVETPPHLPTSRRDVRRAHFLIGTWG